MFCLSVKPYDIVRRKTENLTLILENILSRFVFDASDCEVLARRREAYSRNIYDAHVLINSAPYRLVGVGSGGVCSGIAIYLQSDYIHA